ncbi:tetratricopeptide repeat protein [Mucilaginibacter sp.]|uniref:tetratricopeptide repeat protein n=1 Tax=Mucilaginibacter sp. TaxID=1882438 RepID=UPI0028504661|nr:tetratricopeptide repeat protein [Mucilaginibacter sp.]MDR3697670.1 tetratricopeptide repeat protein [Mucilaginibacter sp.]
MADQILRTGFRFYQSANADAESIKESFIIRKHEYEIIMEDIRRNPMKGSVQHYLLLGRRGSGKSTLLKRIQVEIDSNEELSKSYIAINLAEEQANIYRLSDLWEEILQELEHAELDVTMPEWDDDQQDYSRKLISAVHDAINKSGKKVVLLLDNIDRIFENLKDDTGLLREYLLNFDDLKIVGGSTRMTEHFWKYDQPFYEFFRILTLPPLTSDEVKTLLLHWSEKLGQPELKTFVEKQTGQLETVRILTDGLPRTLQFFVNILLTNTQETGYEYLRLIMDQVTPLYQERLNNLPSAQRKIILQMAFSWEAASTKDISTLVHMPNSGVSAQLKQLNDKSIVDIVKTDTKNHLYRLSERFFNLWLIFTQGSPLEKRKARCLTIFLENFYNVDELKQLAAKHLNLLKAGKLDSNKAALLTKAIAQSKHITSNERDELISNTINLKGLDKELKRQLPPLTDDVGKRIDAAIFNKDWIKALRLADEIEQDDSWKWLILGYIYSQKNNFDSALLYFSKVIQVDNNNTQALFSLGALYYNQKRFDEAEKYYLKAVKMGDCNAIVNLGNLYKQQLKLNEAEKHYLLAVKKGDSDAMFNLGHLYYEQQKMTEAEKYYLLALRAGDSDAAVNLGHLYYEQQKFAKAEKYYLLAAENEYSDAMVNLGILYKQQLKLDDAERFYLLAVKKGDSDAMFNLGHLYYEQQKFAEAEKHYLLALKAGDNDAAVNLGHLYYEQQKFAEAEKYYLLAAENEYSDAMVNLGILYKQQLKLDDAERFYLLAVKKGDSDAMFNLGHLYYEQQKFAEAEKYYLSALKAGDNDAIINIGNLYYEQGKFEEAEKYYLMAIEKDDVDAAFSLGLLYQEQQIDDQAEHYYKLAVEKGHPGAMFNLGKLYYEKEQFADAIKYYSIAIQNGNVGAMSELGNVYMALEQQKEAEKYFLMASEKNDDIGKHNLAYFYYCTNKNRDRAKELLNSTLIEETDHNGSSLKILLTLWNGDIKEACLKFQNLISTYIDDTEAFGFIQQTLLQFLVHNQINFILKLFRDKVFGKQLLENCKPIFYAASILSKEDKVIELKAPPEIQGTINEILDYVNEKRNFYYGQ